MHFSFRSQPFKEVSGADRTGFSTDVCSKVFLEVRRMRIGGLYLSCLAFCGLWVVLPTAGAVQYMGYYSNSIPQSYPRTNTIFLGWNAGISDTANATTVNSVPSGTYVVFDVTNLFFSGTPITAPDGKPATKYALNSAYYLAHWPTFSKALSPGRVVAFYMIDEPNRNPVSLSDLGTATAAIHAVFPYPGTAVMTAFGYNASDPFVAATVQEYDWVGLDCYTNGSLTCAGKPYANEFSTLQGMARANARMFLIPQGYETPAGCCDSALEQEYGYMLNLAMGNPAVVAIFPWLWPTWEDYVGIENLPALQPDLNQMGNALALFNDLADGWNYPSDVVPIFQTFGNWYAWSPVSPVPSFYLHGLAFFAYSSPQAGTVPLYSCIRVNGGKGFTTVWLSTTATTCGSPIGYVLTSSVSGSTPIAVTNGGSSATVYSVPETIP